MKRRPAQSAIADAARLGRALRAARKGAGLTQADLACRLAVTQPVIADLEAGRHDAGISRYAAAAAALGLTLSALIAAAEGPPGDP